MSNKKKWILFGCFAVFSITQILGQKKQVRYSGFFNSFYYRGPMNYTIGLGTAMYRGDLCGRPDCNSFDPGFNVGINYKIWPHIAIGTELSYFHLAAHSHGGEVLKTFTSSDFDIKLYGRYTLFETKIRRAQDKKRPPRRLSPYVLVGISALYYHTTSQASQKSSPLHQNGSSTGVTMGWPLGAGLSFYISKRISLLSECLYVNTFSDHLDNVEGKNRTGWHDSYLMGVLKLQINFARSSNQ